MGLGDEEDTTQQDAPPRVEDAPPGAEDAPPRAEGAPAEEVDVDDSASHEDSNDSDDEMAKHTWVLENISKITENRIYSPEFVLEDYSWRFMIFPKGNKVPDMISIYLEVCPHDKPVGWKANAQFQLTIKNHKNLKKSLRQESSHVFRAGATDWGFAKFAFHADLFPEHLGFMRNDSLELFVEMEVLQHSGGYYSWDSRKETGFVGIRNQGATCYMNSLLQTMFFNGAFRRAVYSIPTDGEKANKSIPYALQRLFYGLQHSEDAVGTEELTKSFGWDSYESFTQHDVQELARVLCDNLEGKFKGTPAEGTIDKLWAGKMLSYIRCVNVPYESSREESFLDISLLVKGMKNVYDAFDAFVAEETLDGANMYSTDDFGKQAAVKGLRFAALPPVLHLHLKRFEFDWSRNCYTKVNDRFEYPPVLELDKYMTADADRSISQLYDLYGVLIHSGGAQGGHYYAFCRPTSEPAWYCFNDDRVSRVKDKEALAANYGMSDKESLGAVHRFRSLRLSRRFTTAYMLIYVRRGDAATIMAPVGDEEVPHHVRDAITREVAEREETARQRRDAHLYSPVQVLREANLAAHTDADLVAPASIETLKLKSDAPLTELMRLVSEADGVPAERYRLFSCIQRENGTLRIGKHIPHAQWGTQLRAAVTLYRNTNALRVFVQRLADGEADALAPDARLVALKYYTPVTKSLRFVGLTYITDATRVQDLFPIVNAAVGNAAGTALVAVEEVMPKRVDALAPDRVLAEQAGAADPIGTGDIVVFQSAEPAPEGTEMATIAEYFGWLDRRLRVVFKELKKGDADPGIVLDVMSGMNYDAVGAVVGAALSVPGANVRFTQMDVYTKKPRYYPLARVFPTYPVTSRLYVIDEMLASYSTQTIGRFDVLFYEVLDVALVDLESKTRVEFDYFSAAGKLVSKHSLLVDKNGTVSDMLAQFRAAQPEGTVVPDALRLLEITNHKLSKVLVPTEPIRMLASYYNYRLEAVPADDLDAATVVPGALVAPRVTFVNHYARNAYHTFGDPFVIVVRPGETLASLKARVKARFELDDAAVAAWRYVLVSFNTTTPIEDEAPVLPTSVWQSDWVGIKHEGLSTDEMLKITAPVGGMRPLHVEKAIKISG